VKIQHEIEAAVSQPTHNANQHPGEGQSIRGLEEFHELTTRKNECLVDNAHRIDDTCRPGLDQPSEVSARIERPKRNDRWQCTNHVAQRTQSDDQDPIGAGWPCRSVA
jgi:hypothetical protein